MPIKLANNASGTLATAISASDTGIVLTSGNGALFPSLAAGEYFYATLASSGGTLEIVKVTARSGDSLTVVRAQEGTSAAGFAAGARFELRVTAQSVRDAIDDVNAAAVDFTPYGSISSTNVQSAIQEVVDEINILSTNTFTVEVITATAAQTVFNLSNPYVVGSVNLSVYMNGLRLRNVVDYVETNSTRVTLTSGAQAGDELTFVAGREVNDGLASSSVSFIPAGTGAIARTAQEKMRDTVSVKDFGAVGDGVADDTAAIQAAANYANSIGSTLVADSGTYRITATITITCNCDMAAARFNVNAALVPIGIIVGSTTQEIRGRVMLLPKITNTAKTTLGWTGFESSVGIDIANLFMSQVTAPSVLKFGIGVDVGGYTTGNAYNNIFLGELFDNKISVRLRKKGTTGYSNQNTFYGGQYGITGAEGSSISGSYGVSLEATTNNNTFINPSLEAGGNEFQIRFSDSSVNVFVAPRLEIPGGGRVHFDSTYTNGSSGNTIYAAYDVNGGPVVTYSGSPSTTNKIVGSYFGDYLSYTTKGLALINTNGNGTAQPHITGWDAVTTTNFLSKNSSSATDWNYKLYAEGIKGKRSTDAEANSRIFINFNNGQIKVGDGSGAVSATLAGQPSNNWMTVSGITNFVPLPDNSIALGTSGFRWTTVYATTPTINTSDEREKQDIADLDAAEKRVAVALKGLVKKFRFKDAVEKKGDDARIHVGVIAQEVIAAFQAESLDPMRYGIVCYDQWDAEDDRPAGDRYGVRYEELLAFIIASL